MAEKRGWGIVLAVLEQLVQHGYGRVVDRGVLDKEPVEPRRGDTTKRAFEGQSKDRIVKRRPHEPNMPPRLNYVETKKGNAGKS